MNPSELPKHSIKIYTETSSLQSTLPTTYNQRLDVIIPAEAGGARLNTQVANCSLVSGVQLIDIFEDGFNVIPDLQVMTLRDEREDAWFIDGLRGKLTLKVSKERYESIGIIGEQKQGAYIIEVDLQEKVSSIFARAKGLLGKWEKSWDVWVLGDENAFKGRTKLVKQLTPESVVLEDIFVPTSFTVDQEDDEPWVELFEWVGLCSLGARGSPRIRSQDQAGSYIACYSPPEGCRVASIIRVRWDGLISETFIQECLRIAQEEARGNLVAFSVQSFAHMVALSSTLCKTRAGVGISGGWVTAEMMAPMY